MKGRRRQSSWISRVLSPRSRAREVGRDPRCDVITLPPAGATTGMSSSTSWREPTEGELRALMRSRSGHDAAVRWLRGLCSMIGVLRTRAERAEAELARLTSTVERLTAENAQLHELAAEGELNREGLRRAHRELAVVRRELEGVSGVVRSNNIADRHMAM